MEKPRLLIFASGTKDGGGSGFQMLVERSRSGDLPAEIVAVVSQHAEGGVRRRAESLGVPFVYFEPPWTAERYQALVIRTAADYVALSGWLKPVSGLDPARTINIHPGPLPEFGGKGMYGRHVHEAVLAAYRRGELEASEICMHFVTDIYDGGPVFYRHRVEIRPDDTVETLMARVNAVEHECQWRITAAVVSGRIAWDGKDPHSLRVK